MKHGPRTAHTRLTRRTLLQRAGWAIAGAAVPRTFLAAATDPVGPVMTRLSAYMAEAGGRALPDAVVEKAKHHVLDTIAAMISGSALAPGRAAVRFARTYRGEKVSTVVASTTLCGPIEAALANGVLAHADETDDSHAPSTSHPGCAVVPAALALGEQFGIDGARFLRAVALGYDVGTRVTMTLGSAIAERHQSSHSIAGAFGAAAAAACAAGLNAQQMRWLLDYTAQQSSGIAAWSRDTDHVEKAFAFGGMPARSGVTSALLVHSGWNGVDDILSGDDNFLLANAPRANADGLVDKLGERFELMRTNIKKWSVGSPIQAPLDALELLQKRHPFEADQVKQLTVRVSGGGVVNNRDMPDICLQHMVAVMLVDKTASFQAAHDKPRMQDPIVLRHRAKVQFVPNDPAAPGRQAIVELTLTEGTRLTEHVTAVRGTAENPMPRDEVVGKCRGLLAPVIGASNASRLIDRVLAFERIANVRDLRPLLQRA